jgi:hypothetical protein
MLWKIISTIGNIALIVFLYFNWKGMNALRQAYSALMQRVTVLEKSANGNT